MADIRRILDVYLNVDTSREVTADNNNQASPFKFYRGNQVILRLHLQRADGTAFALPATGATFLFGLSDTFVLNDANLATALNADFNLVEDWGSISLAGGLICCRFDTDTTEARTALASDDHVNAYGVLWMVADGVDTILCHWPIDLYNTAVDYGAGSTLPNMAVEQFTEGGVLKVRLMFSDGTTAQVWSKT